MVNFNTKQYGTINEPNQVTHVEIKIHSNHGQAMDWQATPQQATPRQARRESRILMNNRINDQDVSGECNLCGYLCGFFCSVIGFCLLLFCIFLLYGFIVFFLLPFVQLLFLSITCPTNLIIVHNNPICP